MQGKESWFGSLALGKNPWKKRKRLSTPRLRPEEFHSDRIKWLWQINHETKYHKSLKNKQTYKPSTTKLSQEFKKQIYKPYSTQTYPNQTPSEEKKKKKHTPNFTDTIRTNTAAAPAAKSLQSCPTLCGPIHGNPTGTPVPRILQTRALGKMKAKSLSRARRYFKYN